VTSFTKAPANFSNPSASGLYGSLYRAKYTFLGWATVANGPVEYPVVVYTAFYSGFNIGAVPDYTLLFAIYDAA